MHVRCDNQSKIGADGGNVLEQTMLFECKGICVLISAYECEMRGPQVYLLIVKYLSISFDFSHSILCWTALSWNFGGGGGEGGRPYYLQGLYSESELIYSL